METTPTLAVGFGAAALVLLVLQQLFFAFAVTTLLREGRAEIAQALDALRETLNTLNTRLEATEARSRRVERRCDTSRRPDSATDAPRAAAWYSASDPALLHRRPAQASPFIRKTLSAGDAEAPRSVFDRPNMRVSCGGRLQGRSSSQSSSRHILEGAQASTVPPTAKKRRHAPTPSTPTPVAWPRGFPTKIRSGTGPVSSGSLFYANVVAKMRREN
jgi:hypothetical protein